MAEMTQPTSPYEPSHVRSSIADSKDIVTWRTFGPVFIVFFGFFCFAACCLYIMARPACDRTVLAKITLGMTKPQVSKLMGPPEHIASLDEWQYSRFGNVGYVQILFDEKGLVAGLNDESVFPP